MRLYEGTTVDFINDTIQNKISDKLKESYENYYLRSANFREVASWTNSLRVLKDAIEYSSLKDNAIVVEYELPYSTSRIDCMLFGKAQSGHGNIILIELKQWENVKDCDIEDTVVTAVGGRERPEGI